MSKSVTVMKTQHYNFQMGFTSVDQSGDQTEGKLRTFLYFQRNIKKIFFFLNFDILLSGTESLNQYMNV
jgi:hypothetical protein